MKDFPIQWTICSGAILILRIFIAWKRSYVLIGPYRRFSKKWDPIWKTIRYWKRLLRVFVQNKMAWRLYLLQVRESLLLD